VFVAQGHVLDTVSRARQGFNYLQPPLMLRNQDSSFVDVSASLGPAFARPSAGRGAAFADLDDDGDVDIVIANLDGQPTLLRNDGGNVNHWLTVSLRGTRSNRQGIGAIVSVVDEHGLTQSGICSTTSSYQSASDGRVHFGLAGAKTVRRVEVRWPSGVVQVLKEIAADRILEIAEPAPEVRQ
jgi:enediyne biosynthesis protein E4